MINLKLAPFLVGGLILLSLGQMCIPSFDAETRTDTDWVIMLYLDGDNKLSTALQQHVEITRSVGSTDQVQFAVLIDGNDDGDTKLYYIQGNSLMEQDWPEESDMSDPQTLIEFATQVLTDYPAAHYGLTISSNKGSGWQGVCWDDHGDGIMITMPELLSALQTITDNGAQKLGLLLLETCLGGNLALSYQARSYCNYMVGYADCGLVGDIPYQEAFSSLVQNPGQSPRDLAMVFIDNFEPQNLPFYKIKQAIGATQSTHLEELATTIDSLALFFIDTIDEYRDEIQAALTETRKYGLSFDIDYYVDLAHFLDLLSLDDPQYNALKTTLLEDINNAVIAKAILEGDTSCGFNLYFPARRNDYNSALRYETGLPSLYEDTLFATSTNWDEFLKTYLDIYTNTPPSTPIITGSTRGQVGETYDYTFTATDPEGDDIYYWIQWGEGCPSIQWMGPYPSGEIITMNKTWQTQGAYTVSAQAKDIFDAESDWGTLEVSIPKKHSINIPSTLVFLFGTITDIESNRDGDFRFLPIKILDVCYDTETGISVSVHDEKYGGFPCCGFIDYNHFYGLLTASFICGIWLLF